ncbi:hypothetical protein U4E84_13410 [Halorubrum sp. AD140]|uniref:hypothetical protein n=1 Tax=Halorubrum sp. AD140 TaxID=3050073 RepID=UPI002ACCCAA9|nr:hypothetical protein [Halorubrum sp. AD140]MDZ5812341.1 hypothetical protein [Halorubrum sp. AD140]
MSTTTQSPPARVSALRTLSIVLAFTAAVGLVVGTAGFTAMEADRGLAANVTGDESAYLGYEPLVDEVDSGESTGVVEYRNRFGGDLRAFDVDVSIANPATTDASVDSTDTPAGLDEGAAAPVNVTLTCSEETDVELLFEADGSGTGVSVSLDRTHTVTCVPDAPDVTGVGYDGVGSASVDAGESDAGVEAVVWLTDANPSEGGSAGEIRSETIPNLNTSKPVQSQVPAEARNENVAAIEFPDQGVAYFHPGWDGENHGDPSAGSGVASTEVPLDAETVTNTSVVSDENDD